MGSDSKATLDNVNITTSGSSLSAIRIGTYSGSTTTSGNTLTLKNSTIDTSSSSGQSGITVYGYNNVVTVENCTINHHYYGINQDGSYGSGTTFKVSGTTISGRYSGIYLSCYANSEIYNELNVGSNCNITSDEESAIEVKKTNITVSNSTLISKFAGTTTDGVSDGKQKYSVGNGSKGYGYGIVLAGYPDGSNAYEGTVSLSEVTYTLAATYDMNGSTPPWYVLHYKGSTDGSVTYSENGATNTSSYAQSSSDSGSSE